MSRNRRIVLGEVLGSLATTLLVASAASVAMGAVGCAKRDPSSPLGAQSPERQSDAEYDLARDLFQKGNARAALDHGRKAVELNDENDKAPYLVAGILLAFCSGPRGFDAPDCKISEAEQYARTALKINPKFRDAANMLGQILINEKRYKEAIEVLRPLTEDPAYVHPHFAWGNLGWAQVQAGQLDEGIASLQNSVTEPRFCIGHFRLGLAFERKGALATAEESLTRSVTADPQCVDLQEAFEARARVRQKLGKPVEAREDYEHCRELSVDTASGKSCERQLARLGPAPKVGPAPDDGKVQSKVPASEPQK